MQSDLKDIDTPVCPIKFADKFTKKFERWKNIVTSELQETWRINCLALNNAINDKDEVIKYVVSAPTGSAKTQNLITYCTMLPEEITALISTNLTDEADKIAKQINEESGKEIAYSHHSKKEGLTTQESLDEAIKSPIVIVTHEFYKRNYMGGANWDKLGADRDLLVIDEALDTMREISVSNASIEQAIAFFTSSKIREKYKSNEFYKKEIKMLKDDLAFLNDSKSGTTLTHSDTYTYMSGTSKALSLKWSKYRKFAWILGIDIFGEGLSDDTKRFRKTIKYNHILTGIDDAQADIIIENNLIETITNLNKMLEKRQTYITANLGKKSFNRVEDMMFKKSLVCFDATADTNDVYSLRAKYYTDILMIPKIEGVRDYSNVNIHIAKTKTGKENIDIEVANSVLQSVTLGEKTLIVTQLKNETYFKEIAKSVYSEKIIDVAHWGAITGLNDWKDFDTCIIVGLNHKPRSYAQSRVIINTLNEEMAFGDKQNTLNSSMESSAILSEIIQAINRIRIRKVIDSSGGCEEANIYITVPKNDTSFYKKAIQAQMPSINITDWKLESNIVYKGGIGHFESIVSYLEGNFKSRGSLLVTDVRDALVIKSEAYRDLIGKSSVKQEEFKKKLGTYGFEIVEVFEKDDRGRAKKKPTKYFRKI